MAIINVALFYGGDSGEFNVSVGSAAVVKANLSADRFNVFPVLIKSGKWIYTDDNNVECIFDRNMHGIVHPTGFISIDCAFIAIHGTPGEDGKLQGYLDMAGIPYTACDVTSSALTFNKYFCNDLAIRYGANVATTVLLSKTDTWNSDELAKSVGLPCFVKPNKSGSSVGVSKVYHAHEFDLAINKAFAEDNEVLAQQYIKGREMACGVYSLNDEVIVFPVTEIKTSNDFFDYEAKYSAGKAEEITPADITVQQSDECRALTAKLYRSFNCKGVVRFDYFLTDDNKWWFLEVNTVPGFSAESIIPKQAKASQLTLSEFFGSLVDEALRVKLKP